MHASPATPPPNRAAQIMLGCCESLISRNMLVRISRRASGRGITSNLNFGGQDDRTTISILVVIGAEHRCGPVLCSCRYGACGPCSNRPGGLRRDDRQRLGAEFAARRTRCHACSKCSGCVPGLRHQERQEAATEIPGQGRHLRMRLRVGGNVGGGHQEGTGGAQAGKPVDLRRIRGALARQPGTVGRASSRTSDTNNRQSRRSKWIE